MKRLLLVHAGSILIVGCSGNAVAREVSDEQLHNVTQEAYKFGMHVGMMKATCGMHEVGNISTRDAEIWINSVLKHDDHGMIKGLTLEQEPSYRVLFE